MSVYVYSSSQPASACFSTRMPVYLCVIFCMCCRERVVETRFDSRCSSFQAEPAEGEEGPRFEQQVPETV